MHQQLWGYKVEEKLYVGVREQKRLNTTALHPPGICLIPKTSMLIRSELCDDNITKPIHKKRKA